jgi:hypothetical protein
MEMETCLFAVNKNLKWKTEFVILGKQTINGTGIAVIDNCDFSKRAHPWCCGARSVFTWI